MEMEMTLQPGNGGNMVKVLIYDGQTSFETYKLQFEAAWKANGWTDQEEATSSMVNIRWPASNLFRTIPAAGKDDFKERSVALEVHFEEQHLQELFLAQLKTHK